MTSKDESPDLPIGKAFFLAAASTNRGPEPNEPSEVIQNPDVSAVGQFFMHGGVSRLHVKQEQIGLIQMIHNNACPTPGNETAPHQTIHVRFPSMLLHTMRGGPLSAWLCMRHYFILRVSTTRKNPSFCLKTDSLPLFLCKYKFYDTIMVP